MASPEHDINESPGSGLPLRTTAIVVYVTIALLALTISQAAVNRLNDFSPSPVRDSALVVAQAIVDVTHRIGVDWPYRAGRKAFLAVTNKTED